MMKVGYVTFNHFTDPARALYKAEVVVDGKIIGVITTGEMNLTRKYPLLHGYAGRSFITRILG